MKTVLRRVWDNEYSRGGIILTGSSFLANFLNYLFNSIAGRALGPAGFGELTSFFSYNYIISVPLLVLTTLIIQKISAAGENRATYTMSIERFFFQKLRQRWFLFIPLILIIPVIPSLTNLSLISSYALIPFFIFSVLVAFYNASLQGLRLFTLFAVVGLIATFIKLCGAVLVLYHIDGLLTIIIALFVSSVFNFIIGHIIVNRSIKTHPDFQDKIQKSLRRIIFNQQFIITTISLLAITLLNNGDIIFVKKFFNPFDAGIYAAWSLFAKIILYVITPFISVSFVYFSTSKNNQSRTAGIALLCIVLFGAASFVGYELFGKLFIALLFGGKFSSLSPYMGKAALFGSFYTMIFYFNNYFIAKKRRAALILPLAIPVYALLLFMLKDNGIEGIMNVNILFSAVAAGGYMIAAMR